MFFGSIVCPDFDWTSLIQAGRVQRVLNECGALDPWVGKVRWLIGDAGSSGRDGFSDECNGKVVNELHAHFDHSSSEHPVHFESWIDFIFGSGTDDNPALR